MPNIKSAIKRVSIIEKKTLQNNMVKSAYKTAIKKFEADVEAGDKAKAEESFKAAVKKVTRSRTETQAIFRKHDGRVLDITSDFVNDMNKDVS